MVTVTDYKIQDVMFSLSAGLWVDQPFVDCWYGSLRRAVAHSC